MLAINAVKFLSCMDIGLSVGVVVNGKPVLTKGYGTADADKSRHVTEDTAFYIGSVTKSFSATLAGILMDEEKIR